MAVYGIGRWMKRRWAALCAFIVAALVFGVMWWGAIVTPGTLEVKEVELEFANLPDAFDGYRIVQWSDAHLGTYNGRTAIVEKQIKAINALNADMICFTGDLVSRETCEALPYRDLLASLHAPDGVFSVLGNHDYDDYVTWDDEKAKMTDRKALCDLQTAAGWRLLNNDHAVIRRGKDQIVIIGTENFGDHIGDKRGNITSAYSGARDGNFKIELQHNPYAWRANTLTNSNVDLMLAGHTHALAIHDQDRQLALVAGCHALSRVGRSLQRGQPLALCQHRHGHGGTAHAHRRHPRDHRHHTEEEVLVSSF